MPQLKAYHRPTDIHEALQLLVRPEAETVVLAGGTSLNARLDDREAELVDIQSLGLTDIDSSGRRLELGAMVRLQELVDDERLPSLVRKLAQRSAPNTIRNMATIGGTVVDADPESEFLAALLAFDAQVTIQHLAGTHTVTLAHFLEDVPSGLRGGLLVALSLEIDGQAAADRVARTPADDPIVAAVARRDRQGNLHLALSGVADRPLLADPQSLADLTPPDDFRGSSQYRRQMAQVLADRVIAQL